MATQAVVSIVDKEDKTIIKAVCGCNGYNAAKLAEVISDIFHKTKKVITAQEVYDQAIRLSFGCSNCLVAMDNKNIISEIDEIFEENIPSLYRKTFDNPKFNPRWEQGTADHTIIIKLEE